MANKKGSANPGSKGRGRPPGSQNKVTVAAKQAFIMAFEGIGGVPKLTQWGKGNPTEFYKLYARLIPAEITGAGGGPLIPPAEAEHVRAKIAAGVAAATAAARTEQPE